MGSNGGKFPPHDSEGWENRVVSDLLSVGQVQCQRFGMKGMGDEFKDIATPQEWSLNATERMTIFTTCCAMKMPKKYGKSLER